MMSVAQKIQRNIGEKTDLRLIKKVISLYEQISKENEEYVSVDEAISFAKQSVGDISVADRIKAFRNREEITQKQLAEKSGIKQQHISEIEREVRSVGSSTAKKLAIALNCDYRSLL